MTSEPPEGTPPAYGADDAESDLLSAAKLAIDAALAVRGGNLALARVHAADVVSWVAPVAEALQSPDLSAARSEVGAAARTLVAGSPFEVAPGDYAESEAAYREAFEGAAGEERDDPWRAGLAAALDRLAERIAARVEAPPPPGPPSSQAGAALAAAARLADTLNGRVAKLCVEVNHGQPVQIITQHGTADAASLAGLRALAGMFGVVTPVERYARATPDDSIVCPLIRFEFGGVPFEAFTHISREAPRELAADARAWIETSRTAGS